VRATSEELTKPFCRLSELDVFWRIVSLVSFDTVQGYGDPFAGPPALYNSSIRGLLAVAVSAFFLLGSNLPSFLVCRQKRCDMRIIGYDKENRPVLYFCARLSAFKTIVSI